MWAQTAQLVTTRDAANNAGLTLTVDQLKALKGTDKWYAFHTTQRSDWSSFSSSSTGHNNLTTAELFSLVEGSTSDYLWVKNAEGKLLTSVGAGNPVFTDATTGGFDLKFVLAESASTNHPAEVQYRMRNSDDKNLRVNNKDFSTATGDWARYVAYGPFYLVKVESKYNDATVGTVNLILTEGDVDFTTLGVDVVPEGYTLAGSATATIDHSGSYQLTVEKLSMATVTYKYVVDGTPINYTTSSQQVVGQAPAEPAGYDFATVTSDAASKTVAADGSTVVTVQVTQQLPFGVGDGEDQFLHRGFLHVQSNQGRYMYADWDEEADGMMVYDTGYYEPASIESKKLTQSFPQAILLWHITGNVVEGFKLYNETYDYVLSATAPQASLLSLYDEANGDNPGTAFVLKRSTAGVGEFNFKRGFCLYAPEREQYLNAQKQMKYWKDADAGSTFEFEESYDVTIGQEGLATLYYHTPLSLEGTGLEAYGLTLEGNYLVAEYGSSYVPAYTGVVLAGDPGNYTLPIFFENFHGGSALTGSYTEKATPANCYVLSKDGNDACFAKYTGAKVGEFKAYFIDQTANGESNYRISFGELTSIISAAKENGGQAIFDLQGRRVVSAKGLNIVNGKKVIK